MFPLKKLTCAWAGVLLFVSTGVFADGTAEILKQTQTKNAFSRIQAAEPFDISDPVTIAAYLSSENDDLENPKCFSRTLVDRIINTSRNILRDARVQEIHVAESVQASVNSFGKKYDQVYRSVTVQFDNGKTTVITCSTKNWQYWPPNR